ncbi:MAG: HAMP domain-containing histidine kinase [Flammeovirgaceae bacterium]|nr:HAMP domain-containing histidine kinase [Flammeovirgaceae bacterium]MDW8286785.1 HAMP domain-containing sensor histidine kinase [Flammeovirgaceae bacterium]
MEKKPKIPNKWLAYITGYSPETIKKIKAGERNDIRGVLETEESILQALENLKNLYEKNQQTPDSVAALKVSPENSGCNKQEENQQISYIVSHNFRSNLFTMLTLIEAIETSSSQEESLKFLSLLKESVINLDNLVKDLAKISDISLKKENYEKVNLRQELYTVEKSLHREIQQSEATIKANLSVVEIKTVKAYINSILHNLVSNAIKYRSPERKPEITIEIALHKNNLSLKVSDNGKGIDLKKYGDKLFQLYKSLDNHPQGRGLGLFMTKQQVEAMGGSIEVESQPEKGTIFKINLPYIE